MMDATVPIRSVLILLLCVGDGRARLPRELLKSLLKTTYMKSQMDNHQAGVELERTRMRALEERLNSTAKGMDELEECYKRRQAAAQVDDARQDCDDHVTSVADANNPLFNDPNPLTDSAWTVLMEAFQAEKMKRKVQADHVMAQLHTVQSDVQAALEKAAQTTERLDDLDRRIKNGVQSLPGVPVPRGFNGLPGLPGLRGPKGDTGSPGNNGQRGDTGDTGPRGSDGRPGIPGLRNLKGRKGEIGFTGFEGDIGTTGPRGINGQDGISGIQGRKGDSGSPGSSGRDGSPGKPGQTGESGPVGPPGKVGIPGAMGPAEPKGSPGPKGPPGPQGRYGVQGPPGAPGPMRSPTGNQ